MSADESEHVRRSESNRARASEVERSILPRPCCYNMSLPTPSVYLPPPSAASRARTSGLTLMRMTVRRGCSGEGTECAVTREGCRSRWSAFGAR